MASLQARHQRNCALGRPWTSFADAQQGCTCRPMYHTAARDGGGKLVREPVGHDRKLARRALNAIQVKIDQGTYEAPSNLTVADWCDEYLGNLADSDSVEE